MPFYFTPISVFDIKIWFNSFPTSLAQSSQHQVCLKRSIEKLLFHMEMKLSFSQWLQVPVARPNLQHLSCDFYDLPEDNIIRILTCPLEGRGVATSCMAVPWPGHP